MLLAQGKRLPNPGLKENELLLKPTLPLISSTNSRRLILNSAGFCERCTEAFATGALTLVALTFGEGAGSLPLAIDFLPNDMVSVHN
jgi:hypothetical protein